tara:strand:- start:25282 stop:29172 length:3891 start_codon:yes stop_codon:yes gene_type:complete
MPTSTVSTSSQSTIYTPESINSVDTTSQSISNYTNPITYIRSRNISFDTTRLKSITRFYAFFQGIDISKYIIPKLLEITMVSGKFQTGETVKSDSNFTSSKISFRLCSPNHKTGPYNSPLDTFSLLPYNQQSPPTNYSESSTFLNVDIRSLELPSENDFYGQIAPNMRLIGQTSGAVAKISNIRLVSDNFGRLIGSFFIPDPNIPENPMWINGDNTFTLIDTPTLNNTPGAINLGGTLINQSSGDSVFSSSGNFNITETNILTTRNTKVYSGYNIITNTVTNTPTNTSTSGPIAAAPGSSTQTGLNIYVPVDSSVTASGFVQSLYTNQLGRRPDAAGELYWTSTYNQYIAQGYSDSQARSQITSDFAKGAAQEGVGTVASSTPTFQITRVTSTPGTVTTSTPVGSSSVTASLTSAYSTSLGRAPDAAGLAYWQNQVSTGALTLLQAQNLIATSAESQARSCPYSDPLAQSFFVKEDTGIFLTSVDIYFETKSADTPVTLQIRTMIAGVPSNVVIPFSEVTLDPDKINLSTNGSISTKFTFPSPVYLTGPQQQNASQRPNDQDTQGEYSIVLLSNSTDYRVFISRLGENDLQSGVQISKQPSLGSLFKSQNSSTWTPSQYDDLKYRINRATFTNQGFVRFFNPKLGFGNKTLTVTESNQFLPLAKKILVSLGSTGYDEINVISGVTLSQGSATGTLTGIAGSVTVGTGVTVSNAGVGYTNGTFNAVSLITETGYGQGATANVVVASNIINSVTITSGGFGYQVGDSLLVPNLGKNVGFGGKVVVNSLASNNAFVIDNVQGTFVAGITTISYINSAGATTFVGSGVTISGISQDQYYDGLHMKVSHINHGMHSPANYVKISEMRPMNNDTYTTLSANLSASETTTISVVSGVGFTNFEGVTVSSSNPGYAIIGNEIIKYTGVSGNTLTTLTRAIDGTQAQSASIGILVYKYEFNGVSLRRINKTHNFAEVDTINHPIDLNSYYIKIDMDGTDFDGVGIGSNRSNNLYFKKTIQTGESGTVLTNNIQYETIVPSVRSITLAKTSLTAKVRTFSGTSIGGNEISFVDNGFQDISIDSSTDFLSPNIICSDINESRFNLNSPGNRSLTMEMLMSTTDSRVSPVIDSTGVSMILRSNLINDPVGIQTASTYALDDSVRSIYSDKHSSIYISKPVSLKLPANSLKVLLSASINDNSDIRVLYRLFRDDSSDISQNYELFPGYSNYQIDGNGIKRVVDPSLNDGSSDSYVQQSSDRSFKDYEYSIDDLPDFKVFSIKIIMAGTNQATPPFIRDLRAIATIKPII